MNNKVVLIILIVLNVMVLSGQLWPDAAPPFAKIVNIIFLALSLIYFALSLAKKRS